MSNLIRQHQTEIDKICQDSGIIYLAIFGSEARN